MAGALEDARKANTARRGSDPARRTVLRDRKDSDRWPICERQNKTQENHSPSVAQSSPQQRRELFEVERRQLVSACGPSDILITPAYFEYCSDQTCGK